MILAVLILAYVCCLVYSWCDSFDFVDFATNVFLGSMLYWIIFGGIAFGVANLVAKEVSRIDHSSPIYSLNTSAEISGSFVLGSGRIDSTEYYVCFRRDDRGGYYRFVRPVNNSYIFEKEEQPRVVWQTVIKRAPWWVSFMGVDFKSETSYDFIVPPGTVIQKFEVE